MFIVSLYFWAQVAVAQDTIPLNSYHSFNASFHSGYSYSWWFVDGDGNKTFFSSQTNSTEEAYWDKEGNYELFVQATDEHGCLSEVISRPFVVKFVENFVPSLIALPDVNLGYENSMISGNVGINDFDFLGKNLELVYSLEGESLPGLTFSPDGLLRTVSNWMLACNGQNSCNSGKYNRKYCSGSIARCRHYSTGKNSYQQFVGKRH